MSFNGLTFNVSANKMSFHLQFYVLVQNIPRLILGLPVIILLLTSLMMMMMMMMIMTMMMMMMMMMMTTTTTMMMINIIAFKGAIRDSLPSLHCAANCLQHVRSDGQGAVEY